MTDEYIQFDRKMMQIKKIYSLNRPTKRALRTITSRACLAPKFYTFLNYTRATATNNMTQVLIHASLKLASMHQFRIRCSKTRARAESMK